MALPQVRARGTCPGGGASRSSVPVRFELPAAALATAGAEGARITWTLRASAQLSEADYGCSFEVPIADGPQWASGARQTWPEEAVPGAEEPEVSIYGRREGEAMAFRFKGQWNRASEVITAAYFVFWFQLMWLATGRTLDWTVWAMFGVGLFFLGTLLAPWFSSTETRVTPRSVRVVRSWPWGRRSRSIATEDVSDVEVVPEGLRTGLLDATDYYRVNLITRDGRKVKAAGHLRERRAAEVAAAQIQTAISRAATAARPQAPAAVA